MTSRLPTALVRQREQAALEPAAQPTSADVGEISEADWQAGLVRVQRRQTRLAQIIRQVLIEGVHYGIPQTRSGRGVFPRPILYTAGAEELRQRFRLSCHTVAVERTVTAEYVEVLLRMQIRDSMGRVLAERSATCCSQETRFAARDGGGRTYQDARETLPQCLAMAQKRCEVALTREATGASAYFLDAGVYEAAIEARDTDASPAEGARRDPRLVLRARIAQALTLPFVSASLAETTRARLAEAAEEATAAGEGHALREILDDLEDAYRHAIEPSQEDDHARDDAAS